MNGWQCCGLIASRGRGDRLLPRRCHSAASNTSAEPAGMTAATGTVRCVSGCSAASGSQGFLG